MEESIIAHFLLIPILFFRPVPFPPHHRAPHFDAGGQKRATDSQLQGGWDSRARDPVVQRRRARAHRPFQPQVASGHPSGWISVFPPGDPEQERAGRRHVLVRGHKRRRIRQEQKCHSDSCRY